MPFEDAWKLNASEVVALTTSGKVSVESYALSLLERINARNDSIKAWAFLDPELVIAQAKMLDRVEPSKRGKLHGVAVAVKDVMYTKGMAL
jgi:Asp-tRNA(Asn)/Glu-tRNA(Gln) amidotransferase A subunit family amidase